MYVRHNILSFNKTILFISLILKNNFSLNKEDRAIYKLGCKKK